jgi:hypothetical protein
MPQQELNLLQLTTAVVAQLRAGPPQVVRCNVLQACSLAAASDDVPNHILRDTFAPHLSRPGDGSEDSSLCDPRRHHPLIERRLNPRWNRHGTNVATLTYQVHDGPMTLAHLDLVQLQADQLGSAKTTTKQHRQHGKVSFRPHAHARSMFEDLGTLRSTQPVAGAKPKLLDALHSADSGSQFRAQQAGVRGFVREPSYGRELLVDRIRGQPA